MAALAEVYVWMVFRLSMVRREYRELDNLFGTAAGAGVHVERLVSEGALRDSFEVEKWRVYDE